MRIGVVVDNELNDDKRVLKEIRILQEAGHQAAVLCFGFDNKEYPAPGNFAVSRIRISKRLKNILFFLFNSIPAYEWMWSRKISTFISVNRIEALHVHDLYMSKAAAGGIKKAGRSIPIVLDLHENYPYAVRSYNWTKGLLRNLIARPLAWQHKEREYLGYASKIIVLSEDFRNTLTERYPSLEKERFVVFPNVPDLLQTDSVSETAPGIVPDSSRPVVLYFGVVAERRGIFDVLNVFEKLAGENHPSRFLIIGPVDKADRQRFFEIINSENLDNIVYYIPWIDLSELMVYLDISDICIAPFHKNPQHESGVANKVFDYMLGKKPLIVSDCKPQAEIVEKFKCGIVYKNNEELKEAIETLSADPVLRKEMGENAYKAVTGHFNLELIKKELIRLYDELQTAFHKT